MSQNLNRYLALLACLFLNVFLEPLDSGADIMKAVHDRDQLLMEYLKEWDELGLDLIMTPASLLPAPMQVSHQIIIKPPKIRAKFKC